jgi:sugar (pentulose or hexulose) kinase/phosphoglycerate dehydrogenase-like enzyme/ribulose-5-phosphate 4-epimerase/fuculose-1-phosphate aldolase/putative sterol carrier protein
MAARYLMALDAGGGGGHCLLVDPESGRFLRTFRRWVHRPAAATGGLGFDLDLDDIWSALVLAAREALERAGAGRNGILGIAATSMRHTTIVLDGAGRALLAVPNRDSRAVVEGFQLAGERGGEIYARTGRWPGPLATASRLLWLRTCQPDVWQRAAVVLSLSDWIAAQLCAELAADPTQAEETLLLDVTTRDWARDLAEQLGIPLKLMPPLQSAGTRLGTLTAVAAEALGLAPGIPVAVGGADTQCGLLGAAAVRPGDVAAIAGTTVPIQLVVDRPCVDRGERLWTGCHVMTDLWVLESNAGPIGEALDWFARMFFPDSPHPVARFLAEASRSEPGASGILSTAGGSVMNARELRLPSGIVALSHLSTMHDPERRRHLARAVVEGMACTLRANLEQLCEVAAATPAALRFAGGLSRSEMLAQLIAEVSGLTVQVGRSAEATALGAATCAGVGAGVFRDLAAGVQHLCGQVRTFNGEAERTRTYADFYEGWQRLRAAGAEVDTVSGQLMLPAVLRAFAQAPPAQRPALRPRMLVTADMDPEALSALRELGPVEYASFRQAMRFLAGPALVEALQGAHVLITEVDIVDAEALRQLPDLRVVASCRGDPVNVDVAACTAFGVAVLHAPGRNADAVADLTLAFLLHLARKLPAAMAFLRRPDVEAGDMARMGEAFTTLQGHELWRRTIGLVGFGAVGRAVARRLRGCGAQILVYDPHVPPEQIVLADGEPVALDELLSRADFVSLHAAATDASRGLIAAAELARMKPGAFLVNTARAALVDEAALLDALRAGHLGGAALDVFAVEPPGAGHPLLALDNVIATPHIGGNTVEVAAHQGEIVAADLRRLLCGERPRHILNPEVLERFDWTAPRPAVDDSTLQRPAARPRPAVSDLQRERPAAVAAPAPAPGARVPSAAASEIRERMERVLRAFTRRLAGDAALRAFSTGKHATLHFTISDLDLDLYFRLRDGTVIADLGSPTPAADVELKLPADVFDGMLTGRVNPMQAATSGRLSFRGDTIKAMTLQQIQADLSRLYGEARNEVGDLGDLAALAPSTAAPRAAAFAPPAAGDVRTELVEVVNELYVAQLITATGGNVSARIPGRPDEIWITPSQLFKGHLRPESLVRIDLDGQPLDAGSLSPSSERLMHCAVYRARPDAQAIIHAHAPQATILANTGLPFLPISTEAAFFGDIPRVPFIMPGTEELAQAVAAAARESWAVLMQNHGLLVAGRSLRRAGDMVEIIERSAEIILGCHMVGKKSPTLPDEIVAMLQQMGDLLA